MKRKQHHINISLAVFAASISITLIFSSCKKTLPAVNAPEDYVASSFSQVFDAFWNGMNNNYVFWGIDTTNWDAMYNRYKPVFANLNINNVNDKKKSIEYFRQMTDGLIDSHFTLSFANDISDSSVQPALDRKLRNPGFHSPYFYSTVDAFRYLDSTFVYGYDSTTNPGQTTFALAGTINKNILFFSCSAFELAAAYQSANPNGVKPVLQYFFNYLQNPPTGFRGVIIDVRGNGGGEIEDLNFFVGRLISAPLKIGYTRYKNGNGRLDYTPWIDATITPQPGSRAVTQPIVVLADNFSVSLAELTTMAIHTLPNGKFIGETTWGANGPIAPNQFFNGGQFTAANFLYAYTSSSMFKYLDGNIYEGKGFPPDIPVTFNTRLLSRGDDPAMDAALNFIP